MPSDYAYEDVNRATRKIERCEFDLRRRNLLAKKDMEAAELQTLVKALFYDCNSGEMGKSLDDIQPKVVELAHLCSQLAETEILLEDLGDE